MLKTLNYFLIFLIIGILSFGFFTQSSKPVNATTQIKTEIGFNQNQLAPDFAITQMDGSSFKLSDYQGKQSVYLVFWNTWCTYCMKKIPKLKTIQSNLSNQIKIIAVNTGLKDSLEKSQIFQKKYAINYPLAFDINKQVTDLYGVWGTPTEFIIDINGVIKHRDGVPDNIQAYLAQWNNPKAPTQLAVVADCDQGVKTC